jgi:ATP-dependent protease Clp ATPase subunit
MKGEDTMPAINYLSELDRINAKKALGPIIRDMSERELKVALLYVLHGTDIYEAVESAGFAIEKKSKNG